MNKCKHNYSSSWENCPECEAELLDKLERAKNPEMDIKEKLLKRKAYLERELAKVNKKLASN